jgi:hypothetical protein
MDPQQLQQIMQALGIQLPQSLSQQLIKPAMPGQVGNTLPATAPAGGARSGPAMSSGMGAPGK